MNFNCKYFNEVGKNISDIYDLLNNILDLIEINNLTTEYTCEEVGKFQDKYSETKNEDTFNKILVITRNFTDEKYQCWEKAREIEDKLNSQINKGFTLTYGFLLTRYKKYYENNEEAKEKLIDLLRDTLFGVNHILSLPELDAAVEQLFKN